MSILQTNYQQRLDSILTSGKKRSYFVAAITVFFILLMSLVGIIPALSSLGVQHEENAKRDIIIGKLQNKLRILKDFVRVQDEKEDLIEFLDVVFPEKFPEKDALAKMVNLEQKHNLNTKAYIFDEPQSGVQDQVNAYSSVNSRVLNLSFNSDGSLENIQNFIKDIESSRRIFDLKELVVSRKIGEDFVNAMEGRDYTINANLDYFYYSTELPEQ